MNVVPDFLPKLDIIADMDFGFGELPIEHGAFVDSEVSEKMPRLTVQTFSPRREAGNSGSCRRRRACFGNRQLYLSLPLHCIQYSYIFYQDVHTPSNVLLTMITRAKTQLRSKSVFPGWLLGLIEEPRITEWQFSSLSRRMEKP